MLRVRPGPRRTAARRSPAPAAPGRPPRWRCRRRGGGRGGRAGRRSRGGSCSVPSEEPALLSLVLDQRPGDVEELVLRARGVGRLEPLLKRAVRRDQRRDLLRLSGDDGLQRGDLLGHHSPAFVAPLPLPLPPLVRSKMGSGFLAASIAFRSRFACSISARPSGLCRIAPPTLPMTLAAAVIETAEASAKTPSRRSFSEAIRSFSATSEIRRTTSALRASKSARGTSADSPERKRLRRSITQRR